VSSSTRDEETLNESTQGPVVLVHGLGGSSTRTWEHHGWFDLIRDAGREPLGIDLLGHGEAPKPHDPSAYAALADHVLAQLPPEPVDAIGFSLGARTLLEVALAAPGRIARLVLTGVGANLFAPREESRSIVDAIAGTGDPTDPFVRYFADLANESSVDRDALRALIECERAPLRSEALSAVDLPVLVLLGDGDFAGPADPLTDALPNVEFAELRRCDHFATPRSMECIEQALRFVDANPF